MIMKSIKTHIVKNSQVLNLVAFCVSFALSYISMFIVMPLNSDTVGAYNVGGIANLSHKWSMENGRWSKGLLELLIEKLGYYNIVPMFLYILLFCVCLYFVYSLNKLFAFNNWFINCFISITFFITPAFVSLFPYINDLYAHIFAILLGAIIIKKCFIENNWTFYVVLLALMLGVYQSYACLICSLYVIYYIYLFLNGRYSIKEEKKSILRFLSFISLSILSVLLYFVINVICLKIFDVQSVLDSRFNMSISFGSILTMFIKMYGMVLVLPFKNYAGLNTTPLMKILFLISYVLILTCLISLIKKISFKKFVYIIILLIVLPISMNFITLASSHITIQMTCGLGLIYLLIAVFFDYILSNFNIKKLSVIRNKLVCAIFVIIVAHMIYFANGYTYFSKIVSDSTKSFVVELVSKIKNLDNYNDKYQVYFAGDITELNLKDYYSYYDNDVFPLAMPYNSMLFPWEYRETINRYSAYKFDTPSNDVVDKIKSIDEFKNMDYYPNSNSIKIINDVIVVKFSD